MTKLTSPGDMPRGRRGGAVLAAVALACAVAATAPAGAQQAPAAPPLVLQAQGSFFVGGEERTSHALIGQPVPGSSITADGTYTANQMYVHYMIPPETGGHLPVVLVHGCCLTGKTWETTPDGRMGWDEYLVRRGRPVYVVDQVARGRSTSDLTKVNEVRNGAAEAGSLPNARFASHEAAWRIFRFGPSYGQAFDGLQFPLEGLGEFWKQMMTDLNAALPAINPTLFDLSALATKLDGAVLVSHSQSGPFPFQTAMITPAGIRGIISIEPGNCDGFDPALATLAKIPAVVVFGDYVGGFENWRTALKSCRDFVARLNAAGGDGQVLYLPEAGILGNSHMLMQDKNNLQIADLLLAWIDGHVEKR